MKHNFSKVVHIGKREDMEIFAKVEYKDGRLSISGVEGPKRNGDSKGSCGQIVMSYKEYDPRGYASIADITPAPGWDSSTVKSFLDIWDRWHLNNLNAGSKVQEEWLRNNPIPYEEYAYPESYYKVASAKLAEANLNPDPEGYKYGHAWKMEELPQTVHARLTRFPDTDIKPAWV